MKKLLSIGAALAALVLLVWGVWWMAVSGRAELRDMGFEEVHGHGDVYTVVYGKCEATLLGSSVGDHENYWLYKVDSVFYIIKDVKDMPNYSTCVAV